MLSCCHHCHHTHCCCTKSFSPLRENMSMTSSYEKMKNNYSSSIGQMDTTVNLQNSNNNFGRSNRFTSSINKEVQKVSPNLSLRLSPERRFSPKNSPMRSSPLRQSNLGSSTIQKSNLSPNRTFSPHRYCSPHRHCSPIRTCSPHVHCSPLRHHHATCCVCHCYPCYCCKISYEHGERAFLDYFKDMMSMESEIERAKIDLALRSDFNVEDCYRIFELNGRGFVDEADLKYGLSQLDIYASQNDIKLIMRRADIKRTGIINYGDFFDLVTPFEKDYRSMVENRIPSTYSPQFNKADVFLLGTKMYLQSLFRLIISTESKLENIRLGLFETRQNMKEIFNEISRGCCTLTEMDMSSYLRLKGVFALEQEKGLGFIRLDRNRNGKIEFYELSDEINQ